MAAWQRRRVFLFRFEAWKPSLIGTPGNAWAF